MTLQDREIDEALAELDESQPHFDGTHCVKCGAARGEEVCPPCVERYISKTDGRVPKDFGRRG